MSDSLILFSAAIVGGLNNARGCMLGGFLLGLIEAMVGLWQAELREISVFLLIILVLVLKPEGLLGRRLDQRFGQSWLQPAAGLALDGGHEDMFELRVERHHRQLAVAGENLRHDGAREFDAHGGGQLVDVLG